MTVPLVNFPIATVVDCLLSYLQYLFSNDEITPAAYRWDPNERNSKIKISGTFIIDNEKPMAAPFIVVERGSFNFANQTLDNLKSADSNSMENAKFVDWADGPINIICGSGTASEASSIANFLAIMFQSDRHGIIKNSGFIRNLNYIGIGPEIPVVKDSEVRRWEVTLTLQTSLQMGWLRTTRDPVLWNSAEFFMIKKPSEVFSENGETTEDADTLYDSTQNFGILSTSDPQFLENDLQNGWYYVRFRNNEQDQLYPVVEIVDNNTLRLQTHDDNNDPISWEAPESATGLEYDLYWNSLHVHMELPTT